MKTIIKGFIGGIFISLGCIAYLITIDQNQLIASILFSIGLLAVIFTKQKLFTGEVCNSDATFLDLILVYLGNVFGTIYMSSIVIILDNIEKYNLSQKVNEIINIKNNYTFYNLFVLAILCELCIFIAVKAKHPLIIILAVSIFVFCGFEHSIADWFYVFFDHTLSKKEAFRILGTVTLGNTLFGFFLEFFNLLSQDSNKKEDEDNDDEYMEV